MGEESLTTLIVLGTVIAVFFVAFVVLLSYLFTNRKNKLLQEKKLMKTQFDRELLQTQLEIQEQTLKTISEEIHDNVGQVLSLAKLNLNTFELNPEKKLTDTKQLISKAINDLQAKFGNAVAMHAAAKVPQVVNGFADELFGIG